MTKAAEALLRDMALRGGTWPDRPFATCEAGKELMRLGLAELIRPQSPYLSYAALTSAGLKAAGGLSE